MQADVILSHNNMSGQKSPEEANARQGLAQAALNTRKRVRIKKAGFAVLEDYARQHPEDTSPPPLTQKSLLAQVQRAQGDDSIKLPAIARWFKSRRIRIQSLLQQQKELSTPQTPISPITPFSDETLRSLHTLVQANPNAGFDVLTIWASLFKVSPTVLQYVVDVVLPSRFSPDPQGSLSPDISHAQSSSSYDSHSPRLPTPPGSTPEPSSYPPADQYRHYKGVSAYNHVNTRPSHYPTTPQNLQSGPSAFRYQRVPQSNPYSRYDLSPPLTPELKFRPSPTLAVPESRVQLIKQTIPQGIADACIEHSTSTSQPTPENGPKTAAEFHALFQPYTEKLQALSRVLSATPSL